MRNRKLQAFYAEQPHEFSELAGLCVTPAHDEEKNRYLCNVVIRLARPSESATARSSTKILMLEFMGYGNFD